MGMGGDIYIHIYTGTLHKSSPSSRIRSTGGTPTRLAACSWAYTCICYAYINGSKARRKFAIRENYLSRIFSANPSLPSQMRALGRPEVLGQKYMRPVGRETHADIYFLSLNRIFPFPEDPP